MSSILNYHVDISVVEVKSSVVACLQVKIIDIFDNFEMGKVTL